MVALVSSSLRALDAGVNVPRSEVAGRWVAVAVGASITRRPRYTSLARNTWRSSLAVTSLLAVTRLSGLTCGVRVREELAKPSYTKVEHPEPQRLKTRTSKTQD